MPVIDTVLSSQENFDALSSDLSPSKQKLLSRSASNGETIPTNGESNGGDRPVHVRVKTRSYSESSYSFVSCFRTPA